MMNLANDMRAQKTGFAYDYRNFSFQHSNRDMAAFNNLIRELRVTVGNEYSGITGSWKM